MTGIKRSVAAMLGHDDLHGGLATEHPPASRRYHLSSTSSTAPSRSASIYNLVDGVSSSATPQTRTPASRTPAQSPPTRTPQRTPAVSPEPTTRSPSPRLLPFSGKVADFGCDASIVLAGIRGSGKTTLAIMAATAMKRRVIDLEASFHQATGSSSATYKKTHGAARCHEKQARILSDVLENNSTGCVIVCSWMEIAAQRLLRSFAATNPVIHILRSMDAIQQHLRIADSSKMADLLSVSNAVYRSCTNYEFFNISETKSTTDAWSTSEQRLPAPYLTLKGAERHFLKFMSLVFPVGSIPFIDPAILLATIPTEQRLFTYALSTPLDDVLADGFDIEERSAGADAIQIEVTSLLDASASIRNESISVLANGITRAVAAIRRSTVIPIIVHISLPSKINHDTRIVYTRLLAHTFRAAPEMVTLDLRLEDAELEQLINCRASCQVIGEYSFATLEEAPAWTSSIWLEQYSKALRLGFDMVRFVRPASSINDNFAVSRLRAALETRTAKKVSLIAYNTGPLGRNSACFNPILTTVGRDYDETSPQSSLLSARQAALALTGSFIYDPMKLYVFGANVGYSMSPAMHNAALTSCGMPHRYAPYSTSSINDLRHLIQDPHFGGASVGLPFKVEIISLTHSLSKHAQAIGAVNTLIPVRHLDKSGHVPQGAEFVNHINRAGPVKALYGENTDWIGIRACIRRGLSPANAVRQGTCGLIIGAGGMARAALYALLQVGVQNIVIVNRTVSNAEKFANHFRQLLQKEDFQSLGAGRQTRFHIIDSASDPWPTADFNFPTIIVSCIPTHRIGDMPAPDFRLSEEWLGSRSGGVIIELGYKSLDTPLLAQARAKAKQGWVAMDGLDLLPDQGFAQFELFTGRRAPRRIMRRDLLKAYAAAHGKLEMEEMGPRLGSINGPEA